ncbi:MAG: hypothetical protein A2Y48_07180 [Nitrospirae bacterium RIFCSPLOW2_12_42_9]|nr:MAG: hypothetical protein A2035_04920 [Nitrospirae bacterium GWA2_42_11]OGW55305.1 MAG: hypothetical protein A2Z60_00330 [Nitrospirae bacterium RIFCSPLOWO2_02_42_7]OGW58818.1 MAG: hypothetical protein A2Y48_07180 [Nitrospirae bacterium RIFCSPLOW2_12_42_9]HAS16496.1 hypothetical protein [Nitrospiraceae bacterium]
MEKEKSKLMNALEAFEKDFIISTMQTQGWSRKKTALDLGIPISTLKYKMKKLGIYESVPKRRTVKPKVL